MRRPPAFPSPALDYLFLALIALTIVVSLQAVGIILVVAMLVTPAATGQLLSQSFGRLVAVAVAVGIVSPIVGLYLSYWLDAATGATIVLVETGVFVAALLWKGLRPSAPRPDKRDLDATRPGPGARPQIACGGG